MKTSHVYVLNYNSGEILHAEIDDNIVYDEHVNLMGFLGLDDDECSYMIVDEEQRIKELEPNKDFDYEQLV